jgi:rod shape determining protein RodA
LLRNLDWRLLLVAVVLMAFGLAVIASASQADGGQATASRFFRRQVLWVAVGLAAVALTVLVDYTQLKYYANWIYGLNLLLLGAVLFIGKGVKGARSWISLGPARFQPSEFSKIMLIVALAAYVSERDGELNSWWDILKTGLYVLPPFVLVLAQPDLGTAMVFAAIWLGVVFVGGAALRKLLTLVCGSFGLVVASVVAHLHWGLPLPLKEHQLMRLIVFASPGLDRTGAGYQLIQSLIAVGSGQLFGKGLFMGTQNRLNFLPEQHTDFIFAVVGEELGFLGGALLLALFFALLWRGMTIASSAKELFGSLVAAGVVSMFAFHIVVNVGMTIGVMPVTGLPLPFVSYGGSSLLANCIGVGLLLNVYMRRHKIRF